MLSVLFGAGITLVAAWSAGQVLTARLRLGLTREERPLYALVLGAAGLSMALFALAAAGLVSDVTLLGLAVVLGGAAWRWGRMEAEGEAVAELPRLWRRLFTGVWGVFGVIVLLHALAPEMSPDGSSYHLGVVARFYRAHGFTPVPHLMYGQMAQGFDILYLMAFAFGRHSAAAVVHGGFLLALPWLALRIGQRAGHAAAGAAAGLLAMLSPVVQIDGASAYNDVALAAVLLAAFGLSLRKPVPVVALGLLCGYAFTIKYTAGVALAWGGLAVALANWRGLAAYAGGAAVVMGPWLGRNWLSYGNPVAPFFTRWFPNPFMHESFEQNYREWMRWYDGLERVSQIPWALTVDGTVLGGLLGPVFLLAPLAVAGMRHALGRRALAAAVVFALPYAANVGTRFLIPALPLVALAMALALPVRVLPAVVVVHAALSLPWVVNRYAGPHAWRISELYPKVAARLEEPKEFMAREWPPYRRAALIERATGEGAVVLVSTPVPESYTSRETRVLHLSAQGERLADVLLMPLIRERQPLHRVRWDFAARRLRGVRVVQTAGGTDDLWSITEWRVHTPEGVLRREGAWRLRGSAFPWDLPYAFDGSPVTRWRAWRRLEPGMRVEAEFEAARMVSGVTLDMSSDQWGVRMRLEGMTEGGAWVELGGEPARSERPPGLGLRRMAVEELKRAGITHVMVVEGDYGWEDFRDRAADWGMSEAGAVDNVRLYRLE